MNYEFIVSENDRQVIFDDYRKLGDRNRQRELIGILIIVENEVNNNSLRKLVNFL